MRMAESAVEQAASAHHGLTLCHALAQAACPIALWTGDVPSADRFVTMLLDEASRNALEGWVARGRCFRGVLLVRRKEFKAGSSCLRDALHDLRAAGSMAEYPAFLSALARGLAAAGHVGRAKATIDEAIRRSEATEERWCVPELLRVNAETLLSIDPADRNAANEQFRLSLDWARRQGALSWELRTATSLFRMQRDRDGCRESRDILASVYDRFTEGFETDDVRAAKLLLDSLT
jgi:predicted ATPase